MGRAESEIAWGEEIDILSIYLQHPGMNGQVRECADERNCFCRTAKLDSSVATKWPSRLSHLFRP